MKDLTGYIPDQLFHIVRISPDTFRVSGLEP